MKHIKECLPSISIAQEQKNWKFTLMQQWATIMGSLVLKISIYKIYNDSIVLGVCDSSWMHEMYLLSNLIKQKINASLDRPRIQAIRFQYVTPASKTKKIVALEKHAAAPEKILSHQEKAALEKINDPELSQALTRLLNKCHHS